WELLGYWGVRPDYVMGHSVGELAAACVAGVLSLRDAAMLVAARGRLMGGLAGGGVMVAVGAGEAEVSELLVGGVAIAAVNGPESVVVSGERDAVAGVVAELVGRGRRVRELAVSHGFHSSLMEPMLAEFGEVAAGVGVGVASVPVVSNVTGELAGPGYGSAQYWVDHVRGAVRFADGVRCVESLGVRRFVEVGPASGLAASVAASLSGGDGLVVSLLGRNCSEVG
ncbi:acyltransferase domain-containing protein, partial [Mycobacterium simiae]